MEVEVGEGGGSVFNEPGRLANFTAAASSGQIQELQDILESLSVPTRLQKSLPILKKELIKLINAQLQSKLFRDVDLKITRVLFDRTAQGY